MRRMSRQDYDKPGSFERIAVAALAYADADTDDDEAYHRARMRLRAAVLSFMRCHPRAANGPMVEADRDNRASQ